MTLFFVTRRWIARVFWCLSVLAILIWSHVPSYHVGWDLDVYRNAIATMRVGHDPYADGVAVQEEFHRHRLGHTNDAPPYTYVYSPMTLPVLRAIGRLPAALAGTLYWVCYGLGILAAIWFAWQFVEEEEKPVFMLIAPAVVFFAGLLQQDVFFSGNVAYIAYGMVLLAALRGLRRGQWWPFYIAVLAVSCAKGPFLSLLAVPVFAARRQWIFAGGTGVLGVVLFMLQPRIWPLLFQHYLQAVELQFSYNHDFSCSPAGLLADALYYHVPYPIVSSVSYAVYGSAVAATLFLLSQKYFAGRFSLKEFVPLLLVGTILLNPRVMEYDVAAITMPMALVGWRATRRLRRPAYRWATVAAFFFAANLAVTFIPHTWRVTEGCLLVFVFAAGSWDLHRLAAEASTLQPIAEAQLLANAC